MSAKAPNTPSGPNPLRAGWSMIRARFVSRPRPAGVGDIDHSAFAPLLRELASANGLEHIDSGSLAAYVGDLERVDPDALSPDAALAYWINLYNARAIALASEAYARGAVSVLRVPGAFDTRDLEIAGERLSLNDIEHGKIRRFGDPRIHGALVCGSLSCPTLRYTPFVGASLDADLNEQMRSFLSTGGGFLDKHRGVVSLSRVFLWYGADFVRPHRMPTLMPASRGAVARASARWMDPDSRRWVESNQPKVEFQPYDWALGCSVG